MIEPREEFMRVAIEEALRSKEQGDYAVGACVVRDGKVVSRSGNRTHLDGDPTLHAEVIVIREAVKVLGRKNLDDCILYGTHGPCPMCAAAMIWARMKGAVSGARTEDIADYAAQYGNDKWKWRTVAISAEAVFNSGQPRVEYVEDFMRQQCVALFHS
jgi:tRNA(Arg) A34 adenosine deaminase TadA